MPPACSCGCCGGRRAWEDGFDALRADVPRAGDPVARLRRRGRARRRADRAVDGARARSVTEAFAYLVNGGPQNFEHLLRFVADTVLLEGFGFDPPGRDPDARRVAGAASGSADRPLRRASSSTGPTSSPGTRSSSPTCATRSRPRGADAVAVWCYSLRGDAARPVARPAAPATGLDVADHHRAGRPGASAAGAGIDGRAGRARRRRLGRRRAGRARRADHPGAVVGPVASPSGWTSDGGLGPYDATAGHRHPRVRRPHHRPGLRLQRGGRRRRRARQRRCGPTAPCPTAVARVAGLALRLRPPAPDAARRERRVAIVLSAYPTKRSRLGNAVGLDTPASRHARCSTRWPTAGYRRRPTARPTATS